MLNPNMLSLQVLYDRWSESKDNRIAEEIIIALYGVVKENVRKYIGRGVSYGDLVHEGNVGIAYALKNYNGKASFGTYVSNNIEMSMHKEVLRRYRWSRGEAEQSADTTYVNVGDEVESLINILKSDDLDLTNEAIERIIIVEVLDKCTKALTKDERDFIWQWANSDNHADLARKLHIRRPTLFQKKTRIINKMKQYALENGITREG